jgi:hypothetical protein
MFPVREYFSFPVISRMPNFGDNNNDDDEKRCLHSGKRQCLIHSLHRNNHSKTASG